MSERKALTPAPTESSKPAPPPPPPAPFPWPASRSELEKRVAVLEEFAAEVLEKNENPEVEALAVRYGLLTPVEFFSYQLEAAQISNHLSEDLVRAMIRVRAKR